MSLFNDENEKLRKQKLKELEDKRMRFAERMRREGFAPEQMLLTSTVRGGVIGLCRTEGKICLIIGPEFGGEGEFVLEKYDRLPNRREEVHEPSVGLGGWLGFGKKGAAGFCLIVDRGGVELSIPFVVNQNCATEYRLKKNPLLNPQRRRGDANVVWDLQPMEKKRLPKIERILDDLFNP